MLFWTRAFLCIGTVTVLAVRQLPDSKPQLPPMATARATTAGGAATLAGLACREQPDFCAAALGHGLGTLGPSAVQSLLHAVVPGSRRDEARVHRAAARPQDLLALAAAGTAASRPHDAQRGP